MKSEPICMLLPGGDGDNVRNERAFFPIVSQRHIKEASIHGLFPREIRECTFEEMFDKVLNVLLGLLKLVLHLDD